MEVETVENEMGMIKSNQMFTFQRKEKSPSFFATEKRLWLVICIDIHVITNCMFRVNRELLFTVFHYNIYATSSVTSLHEIKNKLK